MIRISEPANYTILNHKNPTESKTRPFSSLSIFVSAEQLHFVYLLSSYIAHPELPPDLCIFILFALLCPSRGTAPPPPPTEIPINAQPGLRPAVLSHFFQSTVIPPPPHGSSSNPYHRTPGWPSPPPKRK